MSGAGSSAYVFLVFLIFFITSSCVSCSRKRKFEDDNFEGFERLDSDEKRIASVDKMMLEALENRNLSTFSSIIKTEGCDFINPETNGYLEQIVLSRNHQMFLYELFSKLCSNRFDLYMKAVEFSYKCKSRLALEQVLKCTFDPFISPPSALINFFIERDDLDAIKMLLNIGYSLSNYRASGGRTIAHIAAERNHLGIIKVIQGCVLFNMRNFEGKTAIFYAKDRKVIKEIRRKCPGVREHLIDHRTVWQEALCEGDSDRLDALISAKRRFKKWKRTFLNYYRIGWVSSASILRISRNSLLKSSFEAVQKIASKWYRPRSEFFIKFINEIGIDNGGIKVDWINNLLNKFFMRNPEGNVADFTAPLFVQVDEETKVYAPNTEYPPKFLKFAGSIVGISVGLGVPIRVKLIPSIYRLIFNEKIDLDQDLFKHSPSCYRNLHMLSGSEINITELELNFPLQPGKHVTRRNVDRYILEQSRYIIYGQYKRHVDSFVEGFLSVQSESIKNFIGREELIRILQGRPDDYNATEFISACKCDRQDVLTDLASIIEDFTPLQRSLLLKFVTGSEVLPLEGFSGLNHGGITVNIFPDLYDKFPTSSTCSNLLKLPPYNGNREELKQKLTIAIEMTETVDYEPGIEESDGIVLGLDDGSQNVNSHGFESESEVSVDESDTEEEKEVLSNAHEETQSFRRHKSIWLY